MKLDSDFAAVIGIDWADTKHDVCLKPSGSDDLEYSVLPHKTEAILDWVNHLRERFNGEPVAICIESRKIPLIHALMQYEFIVLIPVNPQTLARYRRALKPSGAKDDPTDARLILNLVRLHEDQFKPWYPEKPKVKALAQFVEMRRAFVADRVRYTNRLTVALKNHFPQALEWFEDKTTTVFLDFLSRWPSLEEAQKAKPTTLKKFFVAHNGRRTALIEKRLASIKSAVPLTNDWGANYPNQMWATLLIAQLSVAIKSIEVLDDEIQSLFKKMDDNKLFSALPGAGPSLAPRLLVAFGEDRSKFKDASAMTQYAGIAPVTERSGKKSWVHWRYACSKFLRQTFIEWVNQTIRFSFWAGRFYKTQRAKGKSHQMAIRALAFKWIRIVYRCWQDRVPYDEAKYLKALDKKGSPLVAN